MSKSRLEAFSDGVIAIIITIMVLELTPPRGSRFEDLQGLLPVFFAYALSFLNLAIWWMNHHHMFQAVKLVDGRVLWANTFLLFFLSLFPFATAWMGQTEFASQPVALYGAVMLASALAYYALVRALLHAQTDPTVLAEIVERDIKGKISPALFTVAIVIAFFVPLLSVAIYVAVVAMWIIPDRRIERAMAA